MPHTVTLKVLLTNFDDKENLILEVGKHYQVHYPDGELPFLPILPSGCVEVNAIGKEATTGRFYVRFLSWGMAFIVYGKDFDDYREAGIKIVEIEG